ncbi:MAG: hypothetical protein KDA75_00600 [Planctomycetaceae bacterium]|nr:hypothetical protein [Planctomycetaceae bacterium]
MQKLPSLTWLVLFGLIALFLAQRPGGRLQGADDAAPPKAPFEDQNGAEAPADSAAASPEAERAMELLRMSRDSLFGHQSVRANLREFVALGERRFEAEGSYIAGPYKPLAPLRLEYKVRVGNTVGTLLEVCDGQILHTQRTLERLDRQPAAAADQSAADVTVTRRDIRKILEALSQHGATPETILQAELGIGGLPALLTSIERAMVFRSVREEPVAGRRCHLLEGTWKPEFVEELRQHFEFLGRSVQAYLPELVRIHLDAETLFPMRISYWPSAGEDGASKLPLLALEFTDVRLNEPVSPLLFDFVASGVDEADITEQFIEAIKGAAAARAAEPAGNTP